MNSNKKVYIIAGGILFIALVASGFIFYSGQDKDAEVREGTPYEAIAEDNGVVLMADTGLDAEWLESKEDGRRQIFERYRPVSKQDFENFTGAEAIINSIDITQENAEVFLTHPDGTREDIASNVPYVTFSVWPPMPEGEYKLNVNLNSGETYEFVFEFNQPREVALTDTGETLIQQKPIEEEGKILSPKEQKLLRDLEDTERESRQLHAFKLGNLDLREAQKAFYIPPEGGIYGGTSEEARDIVNIDEYFWLDTERVSLKNSEREEFIRLIGELENPDPDVAYELERLERETKREYTFLAKKDGTWYYSLKTYPF